jgi:hypothetical protein
MVSPVTSSPGYRPVHAPAKAKPEPTAAEGAPGKSNNAIGQQAKAAISQAGDTAALPKNIQGKVASALARGLSIEALLSIQDSAEIAETPQPQGPDEPLPDLAEPLPEPLAPLPDPEALVDLSGIEAAPEPVVSEPSQVADTTDNPA